MPETFTPKTWIDGAAGGTPIIATELNRIEVGIVGVVLHLDVHRHPRAGFERLVQLIS